MVHGILRSSDSKLQSMLIDTVLYCTVLYSTVLYTSIEAQDKLCLCNSVGEKVEQCNHVPKWIDYINRLTRPSHFSGSNLWVGYSASFFTNTSHIDSSINHKIVGVNYWYPKIGMPPSTWKGWGQGNYHDDVATAALISTCNSPVAVLEKGVLWEYEICVRKVHARNLTTPTIYVLSALKMYSRKSRNCTVFGSRDRVSVTWHAW